jgi:hypothetical protein
MGKRLPKKQKPLKDPSPVESEDEVAFVDPVSHLIVRWNLSFGTVAGMLANSAERHARKKVQRTRCSALLVTQFGTVVNGVRHCC